MATFLIGYTMIAVVVLFVLFVILVYRRVVFANNVRIQNIFAHPLLIYSLKRIGSAFISVMLAISATYLLLRLKNTTSICSKAISSWDKLPDALKEVRCNEILKDLGLYGNAFTNLLNYYYKILPFPKILCSTSMTDPIVNALGQTITYVEVRDCRTFIMDLGKTYFLPSYNNAYVLDIIFQDKMIHSFRIGIIAFCVEIFLGYPMGIMMAKYKDGWFDKLGNAYIISVDAIPGIAYYYIWMSLFVYLLRLPGTYDASDPLSWLAPSLTMGLSGMAGIALWVRRFMLDEFNSDYVKFARAKGLSENRIMFTHVLRNAVVPLVRSIPAAILGALLGSFYIENIYGIPGLGGLLITANSYNDYYALQGIVVISALISIVSYLAGDIVTAIVDPRVSLASD